jgi:PAS domain S-box-containing protein
MNARKAHLLEKWILYSVLLFFGGVALAAAAYIQYQNIDKNAKREFEQLSSRTEIEISTRLEKAVHALRGARGLYASADKQVTRDEFRRFVLSRDMDREFAGVRGFGFIQRVESTDLPAFVAAERFDGAPEFAIRKLVDKNYLDLFVIKFIEPAAKNVGVKGLDLGSEAIRRAGIQQAINTGAATVTGAITLVQDEMKLPGLLLFVPVYRNGAPTDVPRERRAALVGVLYAPIVIAEILDGMPDVQSGMLDFEIVDSPINSSGGVLMFDADNHISKLSPGSDPRAGRRYSLRKPLQLPGRSVTLSMNSTQAFDASLNLVYPWLLFGGGSLISALLALTMYQQASGRLRAEDLALDMTKDLTNALRENEALLSTLNLHTIVSIADRQGNIIEVNDAYCQISGYARSELLGQSHRIVNSAVQSMAFWVDMWKTISSGMPWRGQVCNLSKERQLYWVDTLIAPFIGSDGKVEKYISISTDFTAIKKAEDELRWSQSLMDKMSNSSPLAFLVVDNRTDEVLYLNQRCCEIWGLEHVVERIRKGEIKNHDITPYLLPGLVDAQGYAESCKPLQSVESRITLEDEIAFTNDRTVRRFTTQIRDADDQYYGRFYIFEDITERKLAERALTDATQAAQAASLSKSQFLANMSHEIRTPMNAILGLLNLLQGTELTLRQRDYASKTEGAAQSLLGLLNDILDFSKVEAGKMTLECEPFRVDKLLRNLSVVLSANVGTKDIEVLFDIDESLPGVVLGDAMRLQQVLINLGGNAVKFTSQGQVILALRKLAKTNDSVTIEFSIRDTGIGIAPEHQAQIFKGFTQAEGSTTRLFGGSGLGLAISKRFVELMGGSINVESTPGQGSTFVFVLEMPTVIEVPMELAEPVRPKVSPKRVLVVDDNPIAGELTLRMVRSWGWTADLAMSGSMALEMMSAQSTASQPDFPYPVMFVDWNLPNIDGWETTRRIREFAQERNLPQPIVIMVTAHGREMLAHRSADEHDLLNGFLVKPVTGPLLYDALMDADSANLDLRQMVKERSSSRQLNGMRILVVEDNLINQQVADELLSAQGAIVSLAANGQIGVDAVAAAAPQFDVVLMDIQMPVLDGYGATRAIREYLGLAKLPIIAMTANAMSGDREVCIAAGMNEHVGKPFDLTKLVSLLVHLTGFPTLDENSDSHPVYDGLANKLPKIAGLDLHTALGRMSDMRALYVRTAKDFVKIMDTAIPELQQFLLSGDKHMAMMRLHTLKGNAGTLGATELAAMAAQLEAMCKEGVGMAERQQVLERFEILVRLTQERLGVAIAHLGPTAVPQVLAESSKLDEVATRNALRKISALAAASDMDLLQCFAEERHALEALPEGFVDHLDKALQDLDFESVHAFSREMLSKLVQVEYLNEQAG